MAAFTPTAEQAAIINAALSGRDLVIQAGAGTGKTSTLRLIADAARGQRKQCLYIAFNKAIAEEAGRSMAANVKASTAHSLAYRAVGYKYRNRMNAPRVPAHTVAAFLDNKSLQLTVHDGSTKLFAMGSLNHLVLETVAQFCRSPEHELTRVHVPVLKGLDPPDKHGNPTQGPRHDNLVDYVLPRARKAWVDLQQPDHGVLRFSHDHYLKFFQLTSPTIDTDILMIDEAQDLNPVLKSIVDNQTHAQKVIVGDTAQAIYGFTGAVDSMNAFADSGATVLPLTQSFRFGPPIADAANCVLRLLDSSLRISGHSSQPSIVTALDGPGAPAADAVLARTNAGAVGEVLNIQLSGRKAALVGGTGDAVRFVEAARDLQGKGSTSHPELLAFASWGQVIEYVEQDPSGSDLSVLVNLVEEYGVARMLDALNKCVDEADADVVVSTAHKAKGREWNRVRIGDDFDLRNAEDGAPPVDEELMLAYVALTRAKQALDPAGIGEFAFIPLTPAVQETIDTAVSGRAVAEATESFSVELPTSAAAVVRANAAQKGLSPEQWLSSVIRHKVRPPQTR